MNVAHTVTFDGFVKMVAYASPKILVQMLLVLKFLQQRSI